MIVLRQEKNVITETTFFDEVKTLVTAQKKNYISEIIKHDRAKESQKKDEEIK